MYFYSLLFLFLGTSLQAKVFNISQQNIATYLRGSYASSSVGSDAFAKSSGAGTIFSKKVANQASGEFGLFTSSGPLGLRLALEMLQPERIQGAIGSNTSGGSLELDSVISSQIYKLGVEYSWFLSPESKYWMAVSVGQAKVGLRNTYRNVVGYAVTDFVENSQETLIMGEIQFGYEHRFSADTTLMMDIGFRSMKAQRLRYTSDANSFLGAVTTGAAVANNDGSARTIDMSGVYVGMGLRFYINQ